jgi:hypothetical protein
MSACVSGLQFENPTSHTQECTNNLTSGERIASEHKGADFANFSYFMFCKYGVPCVRATYIPLVLASNNVSHI